MVTDLSFAMDYNVAYNCFRKRYLDNRNPKNTKIVCYGHGLSLFEMLTKIKCVKMPDGKPMLLIDLTMWPTAILNLNSIPF